MDFLEGKRQYDCTPWGNPLRNVFGWQRPCYLLSDQGYAPSFRSLMDDTPWDMYGVGRNPRCDNCMAHCGFEGTAVDDAFSHPFKAMLTSLRGPRVDGPMAPELPFTPADAHAGREVHSVRSEIAIPVDKVKRARSTTEVH
jgi:hypothetical protein